MTRSRAIWTATNGLMPRPQRQDHEQHIRECEAVQSRLPPRTTYWRMLHGVIACVAARLVHEFVGRFGGLKGAEHAEHAIRTLDEHLEAADDSVAVGDDYFHFRQAAVEHRRRLQSIVAGAGQAQR